MDNPEKLATYSILGTQDEEKHNTICVVQEMHISQHL